MRLATAMRQGGSLYPQSHGRYAEIGPSGRILGVCALGAAAAGIGWPVTEAAKGEWDLESRLQQQWPVLETLHACPSDRCRYTRCRLTSLRQVVAHLNDDHHWSVERIADWLGSLEGRGHDTCRCDLLSVQPKRPGSVLARRFRWAARRMVSLESMPWYRSGERNT